jgi:hypothetical protein
LNQRNSTLTNPTPSCTGIDVCRIFSELEEAMNIPKENWPVCAICHKPVEDFKHFTKVFADQQGRKINSFVAFCHGDRQQAIYLAGQAPSLKFGSAFGGNSFLTQP